MKQIMPLYLISSKNNLSLEQKRNIAGLVVDTHCSLTGAPETFVNVMFSERFPLRKQTDIDIFGAVRKGRTPELNRDIRRTLEDRISELCDISLDQIHSSLIEIPAGWVMEGGHIMPEPGEEKDCEWLNQDTSD